VSGSTASRAGAIGAVARPGEGRRRAGFPYLRTIVLSLTAHAAVAGFLLSRAETRQRRRAISVAVADKEQKKPAAKPKPPAPPPPRPVAHRTTPKAAARPEPEVAEVKPSRATAAPVQTAVALSNADLGPGGIALPGTPKLEKAQPVKVASVSPDAPRRRIGHEAEAPCDEEPTRPEPVFKPEIEYTASARAEGIEGRLVLKLTISADGSVADVEVVSGVNEALDASAIATVKRWRFKPAMKCGRPVAGGVYKLAQRFELTD
jgi:protein TonB